MLTSLFTDAIGAFFAPLMRFFKEMLGITILCGGGGGILTAISAWDLGYISGFVLLIVSVICAGLFLIGLVMAPGPHSQPIGTYTERLERRRAMRKYIVDDE